MSLPVRIDPETGKIEAPPPVAPLTPRERQVVALVRNGQTYPQIAGSLGISVRTVHAHSRSISKKLPGPARPRWKMLVYL